MDTTLILRDIRTKNEKQIENVRKILKGLPSGRLVADTSKAATYYRHAFVENGKRVRKGVSKQPELMQQLIRQRFLNAQLDQLLKEQSAIDCVLKHLNDFDFNAELSKIAQEFPLLSKKFILDSIVDKDGEAWANADYEHFNYKLEERKQITSRGLRVRSKSEVLIAEKIYNYNLAMRYEEVMHFGDIDIAPDFTIRREDGKIFIWEHEGLTNSKSYIEWQAKKSQLYASRGFYPWDNLIITYDNAAGIIDLREIDFIIQTKLLL